MAVTRSNELGGLAGVQGGFAPLDSGLLVPTAYLPSATASVAGIRRRDAILLDYALDSDISNQSLTVDTPFDVIANQNFTVVSALSVIEIVVRGYGFCNEPSAGYQIFSAIVVDSAGTPITKPIAGMNETNATTASRANAIGSGSVFLTGLAAGVHTVKLTVTCPTVGISGFYCRPSSSGPVDIGSEFAMIQVIEHGA